jgi:hypothetical protein
MSCGMLRRVALVRTNVSEEHMASLIRMTKIGELGTTLAVSLLILVTLLMHAIRSSETSALTRATCRNIPQDDILPITFLFKGNMKLFSWRGYCPR